MATSDAFFITFEGVEGSGKTTQASALATELSKHRAVVSTREPGGTSLGERVRDILLSPDMEPLDPVSELLLFSAARSQLVRNVIRPALQRGEVVVCDRYTDSTRAYQGAGLGLASEQIDAAVELATGGLVPHLTIYLDVSAAVGLRRREQYRSGIQADAWNRIDAREREFHERVRQAYLELAREYPARIHLVDADRPAQQIKAEIKEIVFSRLAVETSGGTF